VFKIIEKQILILKFVKSLYRLFKVLPVLLKQLLLYSILI